MPKTAAAAAPAVVEPLLPPAPNLRLAALVLAVSDALTKRAKATDTAVRGTADSSYFMSGEHAAVLDPETLEPIGIVRRNAATRSADVSNRAALVEWIAEQDVEGSSYVGAMLEGARPITGDHDDVVAVLEQHAPGLLGEAVKVPAEWAVNQATAAALEGADIPGVDVIRKPGSLVVDVDSSARERLVQLATTGVVDPFRALPPAGS